MATSLAPSQVDEQLHLVVKKIQERFPEAKVSIDAPEDIHGMWYVDINLKGHAISVQWKYDRGFGITSKTDVGYGEGVDEVYQNADDAYHRLVNLLLGRLGTSPPISQRFRELRETLGMSQSVLAHKLGLQQASISKFEHRNDMLISTLGTLVEGLGGKLKIVVTIGEQEIELGEKGNIATGLDCTQLRQAIHTHGG